ncbi:MAG TPA: redoxin domain-containing protein [Flavisolibacter sp.]|nr:redoxin domain-containing protein [Flavisolibacter sp.]
MKKYGFILLLILVVTSLTEVYGQSDARQADTMVRYYARLANSANESDKAQLEAQLYQLLKSDKEKDWLTARRFFYQAKKINVADSIAGAAKIRFPAGILVRNDKVDTIYNEKDPAVKEKLYWAWVKRFPPEKFDATEQIVYDYARNSIATAYAQDDNLKKALQFSNMIATPIWKGEGWAGTAQVLVRKGHLKEAIELYEKARANSYKYMTANKGDYGASFAAMGYRGYSASLAEIYVRQKKYAAALPLLKEAHDSSKMVNGSINASYAKVLMAMGKDHQAFDIIDEAVKAGQATPSMKEDLKTLYVKVKGSNAGFDEYMASVNKLLAEKIRKDLSKQIIKVPAANFTLQDVDGNTVTLSDLKGKTVVLDFWATWCGPCKRSFPAMKTAVERFKDNPDVKFLFIHTWEKEEHAADSAKAYVTRNNFPFQVLMDLKNGEGVNKVVTDYKVEGIPTKFVIDGSGNIRFKFTGFSGGEDAAVEEVAAMIELAKDTR